MQEITRALVLHQTKYGDDKLIVNVYTEQRGPLSFIVRLPRGRKSPLRTSLLRPMSLLELTYDYRPQQSLQRLKDVRFAMAYTSLPFHPVKGMLALFLGEFLYYVLRNEVANEPLFRYLFTAMSWLDSSNVGLANFHIAFMIRLTRFLGLWPNTDFVDVTPSVGGTAFWFDLAESVFVWQQPFHSDYLSPEESAKLSLLLRMDFRNLSYYKISRSQRNRILDILIKYYCLHVPGFPPLKSLDVLRQITL